MNTSNNWVFKGAAIEEFHHKTLHIHFYSFVKNAKKVQNNGNASWSFEDASPN
jgi:hypothetical protein